MTDSGTHRGLATPSGETADMRSMSYSINSNHTISRPCSYHSHKPDSVCRAQDLAMSSRHMGALLSLEEVVQRGEFDRVAFGNRIYGYRGAQAALETLNAQV